MEAPEPTPAGLISTEPSGMPGRGTPPTVVGEVDDGADDAMTLVEPEPHMLDIPDVSIIPDGVEVPDVGAITVDVPSDAAVSPAAAPVAGAVDPAAIPPPSKLALDPNISEGAVPTVEQTTPLPGVAIVPTAGPARGLTPADESSVAPSEIPGGEIGVPGPVPKGDVAETVGVGVAMLAIWACATYP
jgi:hypothetical protein